MLDTLDTTAANTLQRQKMLEMLGAFTESMNAEVEMGKTLTDLGISNSFTDSIDEALLDPLKISMDGFLQFESLITAYMDKIVRSFLKTKKRLIYRAFKTYEGASLHYCIILYNDNLNNRGKLYALPQQFLYTGYGRRFPVVFQFIPREMETELKIFETLDI